MQNKDIYSWILSEETRFDSEDIRVYDNYNWNMKNHIQMCLSLKDGFFMQGANDWTRPFKKVIEPILDLENTSEDIEVRDITLFIKGDNSKASKFLIKKYHDEVYIKKYDIDEMVDRITESDNKLGGVLVQEGEDVPEVISLQKIAFCDQTDILGGPIAFKYNFTPDKLRKTSSQGWGEKSNGANITLDELIILAEPEKDVDGTSNQKNRITGKNIEVYIIRGNLPEHYLKNNDNFDDYYKQVHIVAFYYNKKEKKEGVTLYRKKADEESLMFHTSEPFEGRALGKGVDKFFNEQIWTNFLEIHKHKLLESASKVPLWTDDDGFSNRQQVIDMENLELTTLREGRRIGQIPTAAPANIALFERGINDWFSNIQLVGFAQDAQLGKQSYAGQTFKGQERLVQQGRGPHERKKGKRAKFIEKIYRNFIIPKIQKEIIKGVEFIASLTFSEMEFVAKAITTRKVNEKVKDLILDGQIPVREEMDALAIKIKEDFINSGNEQKIKIIKDEFKDAELDIEIDVAGKQHNLGEMTSKVLSIFQFVSANPQGFMQLLKIPAMADAFNDILEFSGIEQADFFTLLNAPEMKQEVLEQPIQPQQLMQPTNG